MPSADCHHTEGLPWGEPVATDGERNAHEQDPPARAVPVAAAAPATATAATPPPPLNCGAGLGGPVSCYSPQEYQLAYGVAPLLHRGIDGRGETVVVGPEPAAASPGATDIRKDLAYFDKNFACPRPGCAS